MRRGIPTVLLATERFRELAEATRRSRGVPDAPAVVLPPTEATEYGDADAMQAIAAQAVKEAVARLLEGGAAGGER